MKEQEEQVSSELSEAKRRLLECLRASDGSTVKQLAEALEVSEMAVRQHLAALEGHGLVELVQQDESSSPGKKTKPGRGRPASTWQVTARVTEVFEERNADLALSFIEAARSTLGEAGLERILLARMQRQVDAYRVQMPVDASPRALSRNVRALARLRSKEGYEAEARSDGGGAWLLIERHCPICAVARKCQGICRTELELFQEVVGEGVHVERTAHLLSGDVRCVYRFTEA